MIWANMISLCETDLFRSRKVKERGRPCWIVFWMMADTAKMCSIVPLMLERNPFCSLVSIKPLANEESLKSGSNDLVLVAY